MAEGNLFDKELFFIGLGAVFLLASSVSGALGMKKASKKIIMVFWISTVFFLFLCSAGLYLWVAPWTGIIPLLPVFILACIYFSIRKGKP